MGKDFTRTWGVEIEFIAPPGMTREALAEAITAAGVSCEGISYGQHFLRDRWGLKTDGSLGNISCGFEAVSPPLSGEAGLEQVDKLCNVLDLKKCRITKDCGLHVHIDARYPEPVRIEPLRRLALLYVEHELLIDACLPESRRGKAPNQYIHGFAGISPAAILACQDERSLARVLRYGRAAGARIASRPDARTWRYVKLNFVSTWDRGTIEFRHHSGTIDPEKIRNWVYACQRMVAYAMRGEDQQVVREARRGVINAVRQGSKRAIVVELLLRPEGVTHSEVLSATGWKQVSVADIAHCYGLTLRKEQSFVSQPLVSGARRTRETRYWAMPQGQPEQTRSRRRTASMSRPRPAANLLEFCNRLGMDDDEIKFWQGRAELFARATVAVTSTGGIPAPAASAQDLLTALRTGEQVR